MVLDSLVIQRGPCGESVPALNRSFRLSQWRELGPGLRHPRKKSGVSKEGSKETRPVGRISPGVVDAAVGSHKLLSEGAAGTSFSHQIGSSSGCSPTAVALISPYSLVVADESAISTLHFRSGACLILFFLLLAVASVSPVLSWQI